jgi:NAD(P)-dependent dehydrogenase (short-subunit alcohol dehydrogenase family)
MKRVLITGANRGIGLEFVGQLLARGDRVFACARRPEQAAELQQFAAAQPERLALIALDVADPASIDQAHRAVSAQTDALDVLINNAGVFNSFPSSFEGHGDPPFGRLDAHNLTEVYRVNAAGPVLMAQRFVDLLRKGSAPKIVNLTSYLGSLSLKHHGGYYAYSASKAALNMFTRLLAADLAGQGVTVISISPGWVQTGMGGPRAPTSPQESVAGMLRVIDRVGPKESGQCWQYIGEQMPW